MTRPEFESRALELVTEAAQHSGLWEIISPQTLQIIVRAVAKDLERAARLAEEAIDQTGARANNPENLRD